MATTLTKERASEIGGMAAGISLIVAILGAILVEPVVIAVGTVGMAAVAFAKLKAHSETPISTSTSHPMRRAEDHKAEHERVGA